MIGITFEPLEAKWQWNQPSILGLNQYLRPKIDFRFETLPYQDKEIIILLIPAAIGQPISFHEIEYIRVGSAKVKLRDHLDKNRRLWLQVSSRGDWSAELVTNVSYEDLDEVAITHGKIRYIEKHPHLAEEAECWDIPTFLSKLKLSKRKKITSIVW